MNSHVTIPILAALAAATSATPQALPYLVRDVNPVEADRGSFPDDFLAVGEQVFFTASESQHGDELWTSDGTEDGTRMVKDVCPGPCPSRPRDLVAFADRLCFFASDSPLPERWGLWCSDATNAGTELVRPLLDPGDLAVVGGKLVMTARDAELGVELWTSDGTSDGTRLLHDLCPGPCSSSAGRFFVAEDELFFPAADGEHGRELWRTDGMPGGGTRLVRDLCPGDCDGLERFPDFFRQDGRLYFSGDDGEHGREPWVSDGTAAGTRLLADVCRGDCSSFPDFEDALAAEVLFTAYVPSVRDELWITDGTPEGTRRLDLGIGSRFILFETERLGEMMYLVIRAGGVGLARKTDGRVVRPAPELFPLGGSAPPGRLRTFGDRLLFSAQIWGEEDELWSTAGSVAGSERLASGVTLFRWGPTLDGVLLFEGRGLWRTDGTAEGSRPLPGVDVRFTGDWAFTPRGEALFSARDQESGFEPWTSDGNVSGTRRLRNVSPPVGSSYPSALTPFGGRLYFQASDGEPIDSTSTSKGLWASDGTAEGTGPAEDKGAEELTPLGERLFFKDSRGLWVTDGSAGAAELLVELEQIRQLTPHRGLLFFSLLEPGQQLWRSDGTAEGTFLVRDVRPNWTGNVCEDRFCREPTTLVPDRLTSAGDDLLFLANEEDVPQLWRSDGTSEGTVAIASWPLHAEQLTALGDLVVFTAYEEESGWELWASDGSGCGTRRIAELTPGSGSSKIDLLSRGGDVLYFVLRRERGDELWRTGGSADGTHRVSRLRLRGTGGRVGELVAATSPAGGERVFLTAEHEATGLELWTSDGTTGGTRLVADLQPGPAGSGTASLRALDDERVIFAADDGRYGQEVWLSDGTSTGTFRLSDVAPGPVASGPEGFAVAAGRVFFSAHDPRYGRELFALDEAELPGASCEPGDRCLLGGRFQIEVRWRDARGEHKPRSSWEFPRRNFHDQPREALFDGGKKVCRALGRLFFREKKSDGGSGSGLWNPQVLSGASGSDLRIPQKLSRAPESLLSVAQEPFPDSAATCGILNRSPGGPARRLWNPQVSTEPSERTCGILKRFARARK